MQRAEKAFLGWFICGLATLFYTYEYFLRISLSVIADYLMHDFSVHATEIGTLYSVYYFIYSPMQLPVGVLMDRYGPRRLLAMASLICALGAYCFVLAQHFFLVILGRALIGFGSAFAFIGVLKLATLWLPANRFAFVAGFSSALGTLGAMVGDIGLARLVQHFGYRPTLHWAALIGLVLAALIFLIVRDTGRAETREANLTWQELWEDVCNILTTRSIWLTGLVGLFIYLPTTAFAEAWGIGYLQNARHFSREEAAFGISMIFMGFTVGAPLAGMISDWLQRRVLPMLVGGVLGAFLMTLVLYGEPLLGSDKQIMYGLLFLVGISYSVQPLVFAISKEISPLAVSGSAVAVINAFVMLGGFFVPQLIGLLLDLSWDFETTTAGVRTYSAAAYQSALAVIPLGMLASAGIACFICERTLRDQRELQADAA